MKINEFIKEQVEKRADAAKELEDELDINGIYISAGCSFEGIFVACGFEKLAEIMNCEICRSAVDRDGRYYQYIVVNNVRFYGCGYSEKQDNV